MASGVVDLPEASFYFAFTGKAEVHNGKAEVHNKMVRSSQ